MPEYLHKKHFTLTEARNEVPSVAAIVAEIVDLKRILDEKGFDIYRHEYFGGTGPNGERYFPAELESLVVRVKQLEDRGILIKSFEDGLIDFPCLRSNNQEVYLCWKIGEPDVGYWHTVADGFAGRQPVETL